MSAWVRTVVAVLIGTLCATLPVAPASAVPPALGMTVSADDPFVDELFLAESDEIETTGGRESWTCEVAFGDGATGGFWRAQPYLPVAPCAAFHTYTEPGTYTVVMTVTDPDGQSVTEQQEITVSARALVARSAGVEGTPVSLSGPVGAGPQDTVQWSLSDPDDEFRCTIADPTARDATVTCFDEGTVELHYDTGTAGTSGGYLVTWSNGAPRVKLRASRPRLGTDGSPVRVRRVGTGDQIRFDTSTHDPSTSGDGFFSDRVVCRYVHGNGDRERQVAYVGDGTCNSYTSFLAPGRKTSRVTVTDGDGGVGTARTTVRVVRRDVHLAVRDVAEGGVRGRVGAHLTPRGLRGYLRLAWPDGHSLVAGKLTRIEVDGRGGATLVGRARLDGQEGYAFRAFPDSAYTQGLALIVDVWRVGAPETTLFYRTITSDQLRVRLDAPPLR